MAGHQRPLEPALPGRSRVPQFLTAIVVALSLAAPASSARWLAYDAARVDAARAAGAVVVVQLAGPGCGACAEQQRAIDRAFPDESELTVYRADAARDPDAARTLAAREAGTVIAYQGSREILRRTGALSAADLDAVLRASRFGRPRGEPPPRPRRRTPPRP